MRHRSLGVAFGMSLFLLAGGPALAEPVLGVWLTDEGKAKVRVSECEGGLCSNIVWLREPNDDEGKPLRDYYNPDPKLRTRKILGLPLMTGLKKSGDKQWSGHIYNPENGKTYQAHLTLVKPDLIVLKGCTMWGWPCGRKQWVRAKDQQPKPKPVVVARAPQRQPQPVARPAPAARPQQAPPPVETTQALPQRQFAARTAPNPAPQTRAAPPPPAPVPQAQAPAPQDQTQALANVATSADDIGFMVQVAARKTQKAAMRAFKRLQRRYPEILGGFHPIVQKADLGEKGIWYRLRVGPMPERTAAADLCRRLRDAGGPACFVRPQ